MQTSPKVKVVLVHPPLENVLSAATPDYVDENRGFTPPMGLLYIQASVEQSRHESIMLDAEVEGWDHKETARRVVAENPDLVGLQAMTFTLIDSLLVAREIKKLSPDVKIIIGGSHPTIYPVETAGLEGVDFAFAGEGEVAFISFLDVFFDPVEHLKVPGIASQMGDKVSYVPSQGLLEDMDSMPFPARRSSAYTKYTSVLASENSIAILLTSRGCPFDCIFCNRMGRKYRWHSAGYVLNEIGEILELGIREIFIHDDTFTLKRSRVLDICNGIIDRGYDFVWEARTRVDCVDSEMLSLMQKAGCRRLSFGVESGSPKVLKAMRKGTDIETIKNVFADCRRIKIETLADFMIGNIDEEIEDINKSMKLVRQLKPDYVQYSICSPYPGTPLYALGLENGLIEKDFWLEFAHNPTTNFHSPVWTQHFTEEELEKITKKSYRAFYMRPSFIFKQILKLHSLSQFRTLFKGALGILKN